MIRRLPRQSWSLTTSTFRARDTWRLAARNASLTATRRFYFLVSNFNLGNYHVYKKRQMQAKVLTPWTFLPLARNSLVLKPTELLRFTARKSTPGQSWQTRSTQLSQGAVRRRTALKSWTTSPRGILETNLSSHQPTLRDSTLKSLRSLALRTRRPLFSTGRSSIFILERLRRVWT